jgi:prevent-host-death family protein
MIRQTSVIYVIQECIMKTYTANEAKNRFGQFIEDAQLEPVRVTRRNRLVGVMVSAMDYESMCAFYADRLRSTLRDSAKIAGLSEEQAAQLLADES